MRQNSHSFLVLGLFFWAALIQSGCRKEKKAIYSDAIAVGDYSQMLLQKIDFTQYPGYPSANRYEIDVNKDGVSDLAFVCYDAGSPGAGPLPGSYLLTLHPELNLYVQERPDSLFRSLKRDTTFGDTVFCYTRTYSGCRKKNSYDTLASSGFILVPENLTSGTTLTNTNSWQGIEYTLGSTPYTKPTVDFSNPDTLKIELFDSDNTCNRPPISQDIFYGIRLKEGDQYRLGWVRFRMEGAGIIYLQEVALQSSY
jgi:hypothetical protein